MKIQPLKNLKIKIAFEIDKNPLEVSKFYSKFDRSIFGINYDMGNSASLDYNSDEEFDCYGSSILNVHVKDQQKWPNNWSRRRKM